MRNILILLALLLIGCTTEGQENNSTRKDFQDEGIVIRNGMLISFKGLDLSKFEINIEDFEYELGKVTENNLLCLATYECDETLVIELINRGANVNCKCEEVDDVITNLAYCEENGIKLTELLLKKGANINGADQENASFLSYAISYDNLELVDFLIAKGADQMQRDTNRNMGCLPIHGVESIEMLELLISKGFEVDQQCDNGRNLLHFAARDNLFDLAQYLINQKLVEIHQKDKNGETPLDYAIKSKNLKIAKLIQE